MTVQDLHEGAATQSPIARGTAIAVAAAVLFGATAPLVTHFGRGVGPFATAALLYAGAAAAAGSVRRRDHEAPVDRRHARRIALVALFGAAIAPACLALGLQHAGALAASLLLNLEAVFTITFAALIYREPLGRRVVVAGALMVAGGALLAARTSDVGGGDWIGIAAVVAATLGWALDNTLTRPLADRDPRAVVFWKALLGAGLATFAALAARDRWPHLGAACALLACGAAGYGWSLRLYLRAQRVLGAARTGSLFAFGPFVGALIAYAAGDRGGEGLIGAASACFVGAVILHATERHGHRHRHERLEHEHAHSHDDGHHAHDHDPAVLTAHSHWHVHDSLEHEHAHGADLHHRHRHD
jgi:drug/metabolite transporter (DMT)-like permease